MVKLTNVLDHISPEFKPFFNHSCSATALHILEKYHTPDIIASIPDEDYDEIRRISHGKFSYARLISLKELATMTVGDSNPIFESQLISILSLYRTAEKEVQALEIEIIPLIQKLNPKTLTTPGFGYITATTIVAEYGDFSRFSSASQMLSFAGLEPGYYQSGTMEFRGKMVKRGSLQPRYVLMNCVIPLIKFTPVFASYYLPQETFGRKTTPCSSFIHRKKTIDF